MEVSSQLHAPLTLPSGKEQLVSIGSEARWASKLIWMWWGREKSLPLPGIEPWSSSPFK